MPAPEPEAVNELKYEPVTAEVAPEGLVENRVTGLLSQDNDYMKRVRTGGLQGASSRGLLNSSMAIGASQGAAIDAVMPIAQGDAAAVNRRQEINLGYQNSAGEFNADWANRTKTDQERMAHDLTLNDQQYAHESEQKYLDRWHDIQNSSMTALQKEQAIESLRQESGIYQSLSGVTIDASGNVTQQPGSTQPNQQSSSQPTGGRFTQEYENADPLTRYQIDQTLIAGESLELRDRYANDLDRVLQMYDGKWVPRMQSSNSSGFVYNPYGTSVGLSANYNLSYPEAQEFIREIDTLAANYAADTGLDLRTAANQIRRHILGIGDAPAAEYVAG